MQERPVGTAPTVGQVSAGCRDDESICPGLPRFRASKSLRYPAGRHDPQTAPDRSTHIATSRIFRAILLFENGVPGAFELITALCD